MQMIRKLMETINLKWARNAKIARSIVITKGGGSHPFLTVQEGMMYFHAHPYAPTTFPYQEVNLSGLTLAQMKSTVTGMGYVVDDSEAVRLNLTTESALIVLDLDSQPLYEGTQLFTFTSNFMRVIYPITRVLNKLDGDVDKAIEQLMLPSARGEWLDYWVSFFRIRRLPDEADELLLRRALLTLTSAKSNNFAMEELISYYINAEAKVLDFAPAKIEVRVDPQFMDASARVREIIVLLKGAGVDYFLNYQKGFDEDYKVYYRDRNGETFGTINNSPMTGAVTLPVYSEDYLLIPSELQKGFVLNTHNLNSDRVLSQRSVKITENLSMTLRDSSGNVIEQY